MRSIPAVPSFPVWQVFLIFCQSLLVSQHHRLFHPLPPLKNIYSQRLTKTEIDDNEWNNLNPGFFVVVVNSHLFTKNTSYGYKVLKLKESIQQYPGFTSNNLAN